MNGSESMDTKTGRADLERLSYIDAEVWDDLTAALNAALADHCDPVLDELDCTLLLDLVWLYRTQPPKQREPSPTAGMSIEQRILHVGGRNNAAGYVEFGSVQAVQALVQQVLRDQTPAQHQAELSATRAALADALVQLEGWVAWKCPKKHVAEHTENIARLRREGGV